jgi:hypothetical protein
MKWAVTENVYDRKSSHELPPNSAKSFPPLPNNVGKRRRWNSIRGELRSVTILDEIRRVQWNAPHKVIVLQRIKFDSSGETEYRLGYYILGVRPRMAGRWTWGQFAILIPAKDFRWIIRQAEKRGWI